MIKVVALDIYGTVLCSDDYECVVIEDSVVGVDAAKRAGMKCIAVLNSYPRSKLRKADYIVKGLNERKRIFSFISH